MVLDRLFVEGVEDSMKGFDLYKKAHRFRKRCIWLTWPVNGVYVKVVI